MIKNPIVLYAILALQIGLLIMFAFNVINLARQEVFIPMFFLDFVVSLLLLFVTLSHIKLLANTSPGQSDPFS